MMPPNIHDLRNRAEAGDARAQYMLAAALASSGAKDEADRWLKAAAENGEPDASYTLATRHLQSIEGVVPAIAVLVGAAEKGSTAAKRLLAVLRAEGLGGPEDWDGALKHVVDAARAGDVSALREIAMLLLLQDSNDPDGLNLLDRAANQDPVAAAVYVRRAVTTGANLSRARGLLQNLGAMRYPNAAALAASLSKDSSAPNQSGATNAAAAPAWDNITDKLSGGKLPAPPDEERLCAAPDARVVRNAFSAEACEYVIAAASRRLAPSHTVDPRSGVSRRDAYRTSLTATLGPVDLDLALVAFNRRIAALAGMPYGNGEFLSVLHYSAGQEYKPHFDWLPPGEDFDRGGQRVTTALLYLNDAYEGGDTHFLHPDIRFKGAPGDLLIFENALPDESPDKNSRHASEPVTSGAKWIASKWFRGKKYNF